MRAASGHYGGADEQSLFSTSKRTGLYPCGFAGSAVGDDTDGFGPAPCVIDRKTTGRAFSGQPGADFRDR